MTVATAPAPVTLVPVSRAKVYVNVGRITTWVLCWSGMLMGFYVSRATKLPGSSFTALDGTRGWPELWGLALLVAGLVSLGGRARGRTVGKWCASGGMGAMALWYVLFGSSLVLGTAQYGFVPYLALGALHGIFAYLVHATDGFRPALASP